MKEKLKKDLRELTDLIAVDGSEQEVVRYLLPRLKACCDRVEVSTMGTVCAFKKGRGEGPRMVITAHMDEIGFAVKNISPRRFFEI